MALVRGRPRIVRVAVGVYAQVYLASVRYNLFQQLTLTRERNTNTNATRNILRNGRNQRVHMSRRSIPNLQSTVRAMPMESRYQLARRMQKKGTTSFDRAHTSRMALYFLSLRFLAASFLKLAMFSKVKLSISLTLFLASPADAT